MNMAATFSLGDIKLSCPWILAPMAGVSEHPFRSLVMSLGAGAAPTELVSAKGVVQSQKRALKFLRYDPQIERPFWVQLFGDDPQSLGDAAERLAELGADLIDINMGCPVRKIIKKCSGSALLLHPEKAAALVEVAKKRSGLPVTVKTRSGWRSNDGTVFELLRCLQQSGCDALTVHARTAEQGYSGAADWGIIKALVDVATIPIIGNGDAYSKDRAEQMRAQTGCVAVMIGRGALGDPWIFSELSGKTSPSPQNRWPVIRNHFFATLKDFPGKEWAGIQKFRQHFLWYGRHIRGKAEGDRQRFAQEIVGTSTIDETLSLAERFFGEAKGLRKPDPAAYETKKALG